MRHIAASWIARVVIACLIALPAGAARGEGVFVRFKVEGQAGEKFVVKTGGWRHDGKKGQWYLPAETIEGTGGEWSAWIDAGKWGLHGRLNRSGGVAEWTAMKLSVLDAKNKPVQGCALEVELSDAAEEGAVVRRFREASASNSIGFLLPQPLRKNADQIETGSEMAARHLRWASEAAGDNPARPQRFDLITSLWGHYDPALARREAEALKLLGFNVLGGAPTPVLRELGFRTYGTTWHVRPDPEQSAESWQKSEARKFTREGADAEAQWRLDHLAHVVVSDEIQTLDFRKIDPARLDGWFRQRLRDLGQTDQTLGGPIDAVTYPAEMMYEKVLPRDADLAKRKIAYFAARFGHWWSVRQLRQTTEMLHATLPGAKSETLPADHAFFNAWGPPHVGMSARCLDLFEIGQQEAVDILSTEDWLGLNHMYGPGYTWTGGQSHGYLAAIFRSGIGDKNVALRSLITVSDDGYLRLKAYSALGQGVKSFFFWTYGPTFIGTENYWSDLRSEYDGIAKLSRALAKAEDVLHPAKVVSDPVAILYSVSHDRWYPDDPAAFVETRLNWHALRHLGTQPVFLREEDVEGGRMAGIKLLYINGRCLSRAAGKAVDRWVRDGGVVVLSAAAATRDEFAEPHLPAFAGAVWPENAAQVARHDQGHTYNERRDLPGATPLSMVRVAPANRKGFDVKAIGCRLNLRSGTDSGPLPKATFDDGKPALACVAHGRGKIIALGFLPGLAYSPFKAGQTTLDEVWPDDVRGLFALGLQEAGLHGAAEPSVPVVEANLLRGPTGSAVVLANYTYKPVKKLQITLPEADVAGQAQSTEGSAVKILPGPRAGTRVIELPLEWTDIVLLPR